MPPAVQPQSDSTAVMAMIERAVMDPTFDVAKMAKLLEMKERLDAEAARKAYVHAMSMFKSEAIEIRKDKKVNAPFKNGTGAIKFNHATLAGVVDAVVERMGAYGLSHRWDVKQEDGAVIVTCIVTHEQGHSERVEMIAPRDDSGNKNPIQQIGSTITYLQRYTLMAATGVAAKDMDDVDDLGTNPNEFITEQQAIDLQAKAEEVGADKVGFLKFLKVNRLAELPASKYEAALQALKDKAQGAR